MIWSTSQGKDAFGLAVERWLIARQDTADIPIPLQIRLNPRIHTGLLFKTQSKSCNLLSKAQYSYFPIGLKISSARTQYQIPDASKSEARKHFSNPTLLHTQERSSQPVQQTHKALCNTNHKQGFLSLSLDRK